MRQAALRGSVACATLVSALIAAAEEPAAYDPACGVMLRLDGARLTAEWPLEGDEAAQAIIDATPGRPLVERFAVRTGQGAWQPLLEGVTPAFWLTVGTREGTRGRPPGMSDWNEFFDNPHRRPYQTYAATLEPAPPRLSSAGRRASAVVGAVTAGPFTGEVVLTWYAGSRLVRIEAVMATAEDKRAFIYDAGLTGELSAWRGLAWLEPAGQPRSAAVDAAFAPRRLAVRHRMLTATGQLGAVTILPSPHQYQFPRDWSDNLRFVWAGQPHEKPELRRGAFGIGICQDPTGGGPFVPWWNAPPGSRQRLSFFCLLGGADAEAARRETLRYTRGDRFAPLPGHLTFTSHYHMAIAVESMKPERRAQGATFVPEWVQVFKDLGVNLLHLGEFHGDGHQFDSGPLRLPEMEAMFAECRRLSDGDLLVIPGEEISAYLGLPAEGRHPGHWMSLFPKPVHFTLKRGEGQPFVEKHEKYGTLYHVGSRQDMARLLVEEDGLAWSAHPRIKASSWTPDIFKDEDFYRSDFWLGAAWKAMPGDLSRERQGERCLDLLDDMSSWGVKAPAAVTPGGRRKYLPGEVDVFKIDRTHELYAHMNINYLRLAKVPSFDDGWQPVLTALRAGSFFVTTGEVLLHEFAVDGVEPGGELRLPASGRCELRTLLEWTFPLEFAEVISGDGDRVQRHRLDLRDTGPFGRRALTRTLDLRGQRWVRFEVWDAAANGAFTQPVWLEAQ